MLHAYFHLSSIGYRILILQMRRHTSPRHVSYGVHNRSNLGQPETAVQADNQPGREVGQNGLGITDS